MIGNRCRANVIIQVAIGARTPRPRGVHQPGTRGRDVRAPDHKALFGRPEQLRAIFRRGLVLVPLPLAGCTRAPTFDIAGSLFPAWIVCLVFGILLAVLARWLLLRAKVVLVFPILVYPCLAALFTFLLWLICFS
jgi:hypothetical protein